MANLYIIFFAFISFQTILSSHLFPHIIWLYWNQGYKGLGGYQKMCLNRIVSLHDKTDWDVRLLDRNNVYTWLNKTNYQQLKQFLDPNLEVTQQTRANFIRYYLLKQHGGVWLDLSIILFENLNWLDHLQQNPRVIHKNIFKKPQVFLFYKHQGVFQQQRKTFVYKGKNVYPLLDVQNAFIATVKQSQFIVDLISQYKNLIRPDSKKYFFSQKHLYYFPYLYNDYFRAFLANNIIQYKKFSSYQNFKYKQRAFNLQLQMYSILTMNRKTEMYHLTQSVNRIYYAFESQGLRGDYANYFTKYHHFGTQQIVKHVLNGNKSQIQKSQIVIDAQNYEVGQRYIRPQKDCLYALTVNEHSILNKYLLSNNVRLVQETYPNLQIAKYSELPLICKITTLRTLRKTLPDLFSWIKNMILIYLMTQLILQYCIYCFKFTMIFLRPFKNKKQQFKNNILKKMILIAAMYLQIDLIYYQYQLWLEESPTAVKVIAFQICCTVLMFTWMLNLEKTKIIKKFLKFNSFQIFFCLLMLFQYFIQYNFTVWNYQGQIYNYQVLTQLNHQNLQLGEIQLMKALSMIILLLLIRLLKFVFRIQTKNKKAQTQSSTQHFQKNKSLYSNNISVEDEDNLENNDLTESQFKSSESSLFRQNYLSIPKQEQENNHKQTLNQ